MRAFKTKLVDGRIFYIAHYNKSEAVSLLEAETGINRDDVQHINSVPDRYIDSDTEPGFLGTHPND